MKALRLIGAILLSNANVVASFASDFPPGGWREASCCQSNYLGQCVRWCDPAAAAVRGERPEQPQSTEGTKQQVPKAGKTKSSLRR